MNKYRMLREDDDIIVNYNGTHILINKYNFNDELAEIAIKSGLGHCFIQLRNFEEIEEKKTFVKLSENTILLTSQNEEIGEKPLNRKRRPRISRLKDGTPQQPKASKPKKD